MNSQDLVCEISTNGHITHSQLPYFDTCFESDPANLQASEVLDYGQALPFRLSFEVGGRTLHYFRVSQTPLLDDDWSREYPDEKPNHLYWQYIPGATSQPAPNLRIYNL